MLFNTLDYAWFFALAFVGSWSLALFTRFANRPAPAESAAGAAGRASAAAATPRGGFLGLLGSSWPRIVFLLALSYAFYSFWNWKYLPLIFGSSTVDFLLARAIDREAQPRRRKALLFVTVVLNLGFLGFFKYWNFAVENVQTVRGLLAGAPVSAIDTLKVTLPPVGISFFTFESMSYVIDVYRREMPAHRSYLRYLLFVAFFPHLVAGPIVRPRDLLPQFERAPSLTRDEAGEGMFLVAVGLLKKVVLSDQLAVNLVDRVFERPENYSALEVLAGVYGYAAQIYCDFSGYTDIAIGSALLLGVRFPKNFDAPYQATDLADFWRRWHISLSTWLRDYLYIPLGGNRVSEWHTYRNLMITMVLGGLWHGASWTFVFWGFLHGLGLGVTRAFQRSRAQKGKAKVASQSFPARATMVLLTFHYVCFAWIFFRAPSFKQATLVLKQLGTLTTFHPNLPPILVGLLVVALGCCYVPQRVYLWLRHGFSALPAPLQGTLLFLVAVVLHEAASAVAVPFVYFQF
ncbi:putative poly(beta-D-mannuronate) O-acetylase [Chondromyces apiculatus DSM 436]|uniref:Putative poly(Beta-D-mannuronate) O-acetylase n=1 Tax=Chondromyces apiculatus DSM 436 TaxID=1192034 RepID=A0A017T4A8_9BACT|nr:putative poly(beta-D-mannuronate) O-acetylase [Chondromyces apiculatus DSM 436]